MNLGKRVVQAYKAPHQWRGEPPGIGDFIRGACHLLEELQGTGIELRLDVSQTGFADLIVQDESVFQTGEESHIAGAEEAMEEKEHRGLRKRLTTFRRSSDAALYVCSNLGAYDRLLLPEVTRDFIRNFYRFTREIEDANSRALGTREYEVLSVRCGDQFFGDSHGAVDDVTRHRTFSIVERHVLSRARLPIAVTCDCHEFKNELAQRYGMLTLPHRSQHGAFGNALPVAQDLCMLKNSRFNYHINNWSDWWSGFSHYTSIIFRIPSANFRAPRFEKEEVTARGELIPARRWWRF